LSRSFAKERDKSREVLHFVPLYGDFTMYFLSRSFAVRERNAGDCEKRGDCIT
jgi:hypothetical protein